MAIACAYAELVKILYTLSEEPSLRLTIGFPCDLHGNLRYEITCTQTRTFIRAK